ncbi:hypothetical protein CAI21_21910 [Alkalilimnicola ehrlichii]|uniref:Uncharacterized protein n=1 Tax=Alkalilimnicola ehrlichii TaxID=351052 RepID=A0A3E0WFA2_9GAMM|nr:hypothetical protein [Alkalilimnicola ehrlichii]RFA24366.1 hypothetical protein CAI21_21910 [Alkalilimnicola ehrlichii]RFA31624.1 hypothetical protein CAL65_22015 [Alkalilimnicola ehrlichii]
MRTQAELKELQQVLECRSCGTPAWAMEYVADDDVFFCGLCGSRTSADQMDEEQDGGQSSMFYRIALKNYTDGETRRQYGEILSRHAAEDSAFDAISSANVNTEAVIEQEGELPIGACRPELAAVVRKVRDLAQEAIRCSGGVYEIYVERFSADVDAAYPEASPLRGVALPEATAHDYATPAELAERQAALEADETVCSHGLSIDCCPLGCGELPRETSRTTK